jgi:hypothetical protein
MKAYSLPILLAALFLTVPLPTVHAQTFSFPQIDSPSIVQNGLDKYRTDGSTAALDTWLAGSSLAKDGKSRNTIQSQLSALEAANGKMLRFEQIGTISLSPSVRVGWYTICYANGVAFIELTAYQGKSSWIVSNIRVSPDYRDILPAYRFQLK